MTHTVQLVDTFSACASPNLTAAYASSLLTDLLLEYYPHLERIKFNNQLANR